MIRVSASPDQRYGVRLLNGVSSLGARQEIIKTAVEAAKKGIAVVEWTVPGKQKAARHNRAELINAEYRRQILGLWPKD
jgi:phosphoheptose isomerase